MLEKVIRLLSEQLGIDEGEITAGSNIAEDLNADSLDIVEMLMGLEEEFGVTIPDEEAVELKTVGDVVAYLENHM